MQNFSQFGQVVSSGDVLGMKKWQGIFYYEYTCIQIFMLWYKSEARSFFLSLTPCTIILNLYVWRMTYDGMILSFLLLWVALKGLHQGVIGRLPARCSVGLAVGWSDGWSLLLLSRSDLHRTTFLQNNVNHAVFGPGEQIQLIFHLFRMVRDRKSQLKFF